MIPTFNRKQALLRNLAHLPADVEVIVVDDGSTDGTREALTRLIHPHRTYIKQSNQGPATARNKGVEVASGDYVAFTDDDCVPVEPWPWPLVQRLEQEDALVAGVGGQVQPLQNGVFSRYYTFHRILEPPPSCSYLVTANCVYRREALLAVGGFDAGMKHPGGEDPDLSFRIRSKGYQLVFEQSGVVLHEYRQGFRDFVRTFYRYGKGCGYVMGKRIGASAANT
ncbi:MAG: glycosyltransferase [Chloroflexi bacterium]|nr:glycosyltransferase [Chloroflexota bacterium]